MFSQDAERIDKHLRRFKKALSEGEEPRKLEALMGMLKKEEFTGWTDHLGFDAMHHAIIFNNAEAVDQLLKLGYFARPYEPAVSPYTHLAARLGHRTVLNVLVNYRPDDFRVAKQPLVLPPASAFRTKEDDVKPIVFTAAGKGSPDKERRPSLEGSVKNFEAEPKPLLKTPLEVAAGARHVDCVKLLLDMCVLRNNPDAPCKGYLTLAALVDCPASMKLLLKTQETFENDRMAKKQDRQRAEDFKNAVEICVQRACPQCLDLLLADKSVDLKGIFKGINFYHVLYTFSASYGKGAYGRLPEATRVLINRGHDVQAKVPPRTYPLYTLITHSFVYHEYPFTEFYMECMKLLLENGADPNFDEVQFEKHILQQKGIKFAAGRNAYSSALHCLMETVEAYASLLSSPALAVKFVEDCAEILVRHSANIEKVGRIGDSRSELQGNVLHQYAKSSVLIGVDRSIIRMILRYGAEPGVKIRGKYAINVYFDTLFEALALCTVIDTNRKYEKESHAIMNCLCDLMTPAQVKDAHNDFTRTHCKATSEQVYNTLSVMLKTSELQGIRSTKTINLPIEEVVDRFLEAIRNQEGPRKLEAIRSTVRREDLVSWKDKWELDILHHAIMMNYPDAVDFLLKLGYFAEPYEPHVNLPHDFKRSQQPLFYPSDVMPVWQMICTSGDAVLPGIVDCPPAIKVLLKLNKRAPKVEEENHRVEDFRQAVRLALQMADIECLDMLLADTTVDVRNMYRPNNYFHILYITTSRAPGTKTIHLLPAATRTMIFRDHNVNSKIPSRTYPLYTLINCSFRRDDFSLTKHFIDSMIILLEHGVNPNFDEVGIL
nr:hypothetical protein BaRGS_021339 [Batillaria attramentaria]